MLALPTILTVQCARTYIGKDSVDAHRNYSVNYLCRNMQKKFFKNRALNKMYKYT